MTSAFPVAVTVAATLETVGILAYLAVTALVLRVAVGWARDALGPPAGSDAGHEGGGAASRPSGPRSP